MYNGKEVDLEIESSQLQFIQADEFEDQIGLFINIQDEEF
jgi:hypothetical protein